MRKVVKIVFYPIIGLVIIILGVVVFLLTPIGKNFVRSQAERYLNKKLGTKVVIGNLDYHLPKTFELDSVLFLDQQRDTLLAFNQLYISMDMMGFLKNKISVNKILIDGLNANITRKKSDTTFNFQYITNAFVGTDTTTKATVDTTPSKPWSYSLGVISLTHSRFQFLDTAGGNFFGIKLGDLTLNGKKIDLDKMHFDVTNASLKDVQSYFYADTAYYTSKAVDTGAPLDLKVNADKLSISNTYFKFWGKLDSMFFDANVQSLSGNNIYYAQLDEYGKVQALTADGITSSFTQGKLSKARIKYNAQLAKSNLDTSTSNWTFDVAQFLAKSINFKMDDNNSPRLKKGMDYAHLDLRNLFLNADSAHYSPDTSRAIVNQFMMWEKSGFAIQGFKAKAVYTEKGVFLRDFLLKTPNTTLQNKIIATYPSLTALANHPETMKMDIGLVNSLIGLKDLAIFLPPDQMNMIYSYTRKNILLNLLQLNGTVNKLQVKEARIAALNSTTLDANGYLYNLMDPNRLRYDLNIKQLKSTPGDINPFLPPDMRKSYALPAWLTLSGSIHGDMNHYYPNLTLKSADGNAHIAGMYAMGKNPMDANYNLNLSTSTLNIGKILKMPETVGSITVSGSVKGSGFDYQKNMNASFNLFLHNGWIMGYDYQNISAIGSIKAKEAEATIVSKDPNATLNMVATADFHQKDPAVQAEINIDYLNPTALKFMTDTLSYTGVIHADFPVLNMDYPVGDLRIDSSFVTVPNQTFMLDSIVLHSNATDSNQNLYANISNILDATITGHTPLSKMGDIFMAHIDQYYKFSTTTPKPPKEYDLEMNGHLLYHPLIKRLIPDLKPFDSVDFYANVAPNLLNFNAFASKIRYGTNVLDTITIAANEADSVLSYALSVNKFDNGTLRFNNTLLSGYVQRDSVFANLTMADTAGTNQFTINTSLSKLTNGDQLFKLYPGMVINYSPWNVNPENKIVFGAKGFYIDSLNLSDSTQSIAANSIDSFNNGSRYTNPIRFNIQNLILGNFTKMISGDTLLADGILNAAMDIKPSSTPMEMKGTFSIDSLKVMNASVGNMTGNLQNGENNSINTDVNLVSHQSGLHLYGNYYLTPYNNNDFDFTLNVDSFNLKAFEPLAFGSIKNSSGGLTGQLQITGTIDTPLISGAIVTDSLKMTVSMLNAPFVFPKESLNFVSGRGIEFNNFSIYDTTGHYASINGSVLTRSWRNYYLNLSINANRWRVMNSTARDYNLIYGKLTTSISNLNIKGIATAPSMDGNITIHDSTNLTYNMLDNPELVSNAGIVEFYDSRVKYTDEDSIALAKLKQNKFRFNRSATMNVNLGIEDSAQFNVVIDPQTGDKLNISGQANLNAVLNNDGSMGLTGVYTLDKGYYELHLLALKRKFNIKQGSSISFAGDPLDARADITALYDVSASPYELVNGVASTEDMVYFRQQLPFVVSLSMQGKVLAPVVNFDIQLPEDKQTMVSTQIANQVQSALTNLRTNSTDLSKQVFSLLLLNSFMANNPFDVQGASSGNFLTNQLTSSASQLLTSQVSQLAGSLIPGLTLNVDLNNTNDYSTGQGVAMTNLNISASKRFLNNRLNVTVGNNFNLDGSANDVQNSQSALIPGNISLDYMLTPNGRYVARAYRQTQLQNLLTGYVVETGIGFRFTVEYNKFRYLFMSEAKRAALRKERQAKEAIDTQNTPKAKHK